MRILPLVLAAALVAGCASTNPDVPDTQEDVPVPLGFSRMGDDTETKSHYEKHETFRNYRVTYHGNGKAMDVAKFYETQMPHSGWKLENSTPGPTGGTADLTFLKDQERAKVSVKQLDEERAKVTVDIRLK